VQAKTRCIVQFPCNITALVQHIHCGAVSLHVSAHAVVIADSFDFSHVKSAIGCEHIDK